MNTISFDIEVAGFQWEDVDEPTREYLLKRERDPAERESVQDRLGLFPGLGKIIAIGMWLVEENRGMILLEGDSQPVCSWGKVPGSKIFRGTEKEILEKFWELVEGRGARLVSYNGRGYDGPMLSIRSAQLGVAPSRQLVGYRYDITSHCDLMEIFTFQGATRSRYSLDYWCHRFGVESPKDGIDGSQVSQAYREGRIDEIGAYCLRDVKATAELYSKVEHTLVPLFLKGAR